MKKFILFLIPVLLLTSCAAKEKLPQITEKNNNKNFEFAVDQQFQIVLPSNQTTGYQWQVDDITTGVLEQVNNEYQISDKYSSGNIVGAGGEEIWTFKVLQVKRSHIVMKYRRPWDKTDVANNLLVTINGNPGDDGLLTYTGIVQSRAVQPPRPYNGFKADSGGTFEIVPFTQDQIADPGVKAKLAEVIDKGIRVEIRGKFVGENTTGAAPTRKFIIYEIKEK